MDADLYIVSIYDKFKEDWEPRFYAAIAKRDALRVNGDDYNQAQSRIEAIHDEKYELPVGQVGYFHDSYNSHSLAILLGWSWWQDIRPLRDNDGYIQPNNLASFRKIADCEPALTMDDWAEQANITFEPEGEYSRRAWAEYYLQCQQRLLAFIDLAIARHEPIMTSL